MLGPTNLRCLTGTHFRPLQSFSWLLDPFTSHDHPKMLAIPLMGPVESQGHGVGVLYSLS